VLVVENFQAHESRQFSASAGLASLTRSSSLEAFAVQLLGSMVAAGALFRAEVQCHVAAQAARLSDSPGPNGRTAGHNESDPLHKNTAPIRLVEESN